MDDQLSYYIPQTPFTDPGRYAFLYEGLPDGLPELAAVIQGALVHRNSADYYGLQWTQGQRSEVRLRTMEQRLARMHSLDPSPLVVARPPKDRQVGMCRDFAVFLVSLLRHKGIPARMRVGFAAYLGKDSQIKSDHWIAEYWDGECGRWVLADADIGGMEPEAHGLKCDFFDLRRNQEFYVAGSAWQLARAGKVKATFFRYNGRWKGFPCIRGNLLHDFQALNRMELGLFDYFDDLSTKSETKMTPDDKALLDRIALMTAEPDAHFEALMELFEALPRTQVIRSQLQVLGIIGEGRRADPGELGPSGMERLAQLAGAEATAGAGRPSLARVRDNEPFELPSDHPYHVQAAAGAAAGDIVVRGARQHNLKHIDVHIPRNRLVVITGVSGSGKSSLAFDTIYAEGQRRYVESLSSYARQFMDQMEKPQVDQVIGLSPAVAIEQKKISRNPRSTVGTVTEILDYLRVLYARVGTPHCPQCGRDVQPQTAQQITNQLARLPAGTRFQLLAPIVRGRKGSHAGRMEQAVRDGFVRARVDGTAVDLTAGIPSLDKRRSHTIELVVDRLEADGGRGDGNGRGRLADSVETALAAGGGALVVDLGQEEVILSESHACPACELSFPKLQPHHFSFNSPFGMCEECNGLGVKLQVDPALIVNRPELSLLDGASPWYGKLRGKKPPWFSRHLYRIAAEYGADLELTWNELPQEYRDALLYGSGNRTFHFQFESSDGTWRGESERPIRGAIHEINRLFRQTKSEERKRYFTQFMSKLPCPTCQGERLNAVARYVTVGSKRLPELATQSITALHAWTSGLPEQLNDEQRQIGEELITEIRQRLGFIRNVGLHYLTLDRPAPTLSGGEGQRIRLASQIGSGLVGVLYILDEPSIGLHARDHRALLDTLVQLRDLGNTVLVVEHDRETMRTADWIIDLGPGPGILGGEVVAAGTPEEVMAERGSLTGRYLSGELQVMAPNGRARRSPAGWLTLKGARLHNLKEIDARFPLGTMVCVTGVSGSGKSSLVAQTFQPALARLLQGSQSVPGPYQGIEGLEQVNKVINITQDPIGRSPRSNPGTYAGALTEIRKVFAETKEAKARGFKPERFSFNVKGGRCEECKGHGSKKVEMHFLPDVWVRCQACEGKRFNRPTLAVTYKSKSIADVLEMDVQEALVFFANHPRVTRVLQTLHDVGLDYMKLGQSALTLSGGEAQRVKLARELSRRDTGRTVYFLDEPTTGLHFADIQRLLEVLHRLVEAGNTVVVIEHNLEVIKTADWIIDLGPEGGEAGGSIVAEGPPEAVMAAADSHTGRVLLDLMETSSETPQTAVAG